MLIFVVIKIQLLQSNLFSLRVLSKKSNVFLNWRQQLHGFVSIFMSSLICAVPIMSCIHSLMLRHECSYPQKFSFCNMRPSICPSLKLSMLSILSKIINFIWSRLCSSVHALMKCFDMQHDSTFFWYVILAVSKAGFPNYRGSNSLTITFSTYCIVNNKFRSAGKNLFDGLTFPSSIWNYVISFKHKIIIWVANFIASFVPVFAVIIWIFFDFIGVTSH